MFGSTHWPGFGITIFFFVFMIFGESEEDWDGVTILLVCSSHSSLIVTSMRLTNVEDLDQGSGMTRHPPPDAVDLWPVHSSVVSNMLSALADIALKTADTQYIRIIISETSTVKIGLANSHISASSEIA